MAKKNQIKVRMNVGYEGRSEMVNRNNQTTSMRVTLSAGTMSGCCNDSVPSTSDSNLMKNENSDWSNSPYADGELKLRIDNADAFDFFKNFAEFEFTITGVKPTKG